MDVDEVARAALESGEVADRRDAFAPSTAKAVAIDIQELVGAAYVARRLGNDAWRTGILTYARTPTGLEWRSEGGSTRSDLPLEREGLRGDDVISLLETSMTEDGEDQFVTVAGFVPRGVETVELAVRHTLRRVHPNPLTGAFIAVARLTSKPKIEPEEIDVRALDRNEELLDSTRASRDRQQAKQPATITVAEACKLPNGTPVAIHGFMLVLEDLPVRLCDEVDSSVEPPEPDGAALIIDGLSAAGLPKSWTSSQSGLALSTVIARGTIVDGRFHPDS
jgi:hypothetical protein